VKLQPMPWVIHAMNIPSNLIQITQTCPVVMLMEIACPMCGIAALL
jgi:hypothetical protein